VKRCAADKAAVAVTWHPAQPTADATAGSWDNSIKAIISTAGRKKILTILVGFAPGQVTPRKRQNSLDKS